MIKAVKFVSLPTRDQDRALEFYTKKLGFAVHSDQYFDGTQRWIELRIPGAQTGIVLFTPEGHEGRIGTFQNMAWFSQDVEKTYQELKARGVEFAEPPKKQPWGTNAIFLDSEGNRFVIGDS